MRGRLRSEGDGGSIARVNLRPDMRALALVLVFGCRPSPSPYPGSLISVAVRVSPAGARVGRVRASADAAAAMALRRGGQQDGFHGAIAVQPGPHSVAIEVLNDAGIRVGGASFRVSSARGSPALLDATVQVLSPEDTRAGGKLAVDAIVAPRSSAVQGERMVLQGVVGPTAGLVLAWTAAPSGCGTFAQPAVASTEWTAIAPGPCTVTLTAAAASSRDRRSLTVVVRSQGRSFEYPLQVAPGGRYLVDRRGTPFFIKGETAWLALANLTEDEQERYLADRGAKGFNLVEVMLTNHDYTTSPGPVPPSNRAGEQPFLKPGDFSTPNDAYFDRAVAFMDRAADHGIVVLLAPGYLGFDGGREGWWQELNSPVNTREVCAGFGRYLGTRFKEKKNLIWLAGGDFAPPAGSEGEARHREILDGIRAAGASQPWTGHWNVEHLGGISTDQARFLDAMALNGVYQYASPYRYADRAYDVQPARPVYLLESTYEHEHPGTATQPFRKAWWWTMLSGGTGVLWSNNFLWMCETARGVHRADYGDADHALSSWSDELESRGTFEALHLHAFFEALPWHRLVPAGPSSGLGQLVSSWQWWGERRIVAASTREGDLLVAYVPPTGSGSRSFNVDLSRMRGPARARWYDPSAGGWLPVAGTLPRAAHVAMETPGTNAAGTNDWALVLEAAPSP
jgi:hypothetical protein